MSCFGSWSRHWHRLRHCGSLRSKVERGHEGVCYRTLIISVAEPPFFWAAPAPEVRGPRVDSSSDQIGSAPAPCTNIFHFELLKSQFVMQVFFGSHLPLQVAFESHFVTRTRLSFFACQKDAAGAAFKKASPAPANKKIGSSSTLKVAAPAPQHFIILFMGVAEPLRFPVSSGSGLSCTVNVSIVIFVNL